MKNNPQEWEKKGELDCPKNSFKLLEYWRVFGDSRGTGLEFTYINMGLSHELIGVGK